MKLIFAIMHQETLVLLRDRRALALLFVMPMLMIIFLSLALTDVYFDKVGKKIGMIIASSESNEITRQVAAHFEEKGYLTESIEGMASLAAIHLDRSHHVAMWIPRINRREFWSMNKSIKDLFAGHIEVKFDGTLDAAYRRLFMAELHNELFDLTLKRAEKQMAQSDEETLKPLFADLSGLVSEVNDGKVIPNPIQQTIPAWSLFGMFFIVIPFSHSIMRDRENGVTVRILTYDSRKYHILTGKLAPFFVVNILQFVMMAVVGLFLTPLLSGVHFAMGEINAGLVVVTVVASLAALSYAMMVASLSKTSEQASGFGALSIVILAVIGGIMIPRFAMPPLMQSLALISPLYWGLDAYQGIFLRGDGPLAVLPQCSMLAGFALLFFGVALYKFRWSQV